MRMLGKITRGCGCRLCRRSDWPVTREAKRAEQRAFAVLVAGLLAGDLRIPFTDYSDCRHGCNGECYESGGESCDFTCHENRCENCCGPGLHWLDTGWFCSQECWAEYGLALVRELRRE